MRLDGKTIPTQVQRNSKITKKKNVKNSKPAKPNYNSVSKNFHFNFDGRYFSFV